MADVPEIDFLRQSPQILTFFFSFFAFLSEFAIEPAYAYAVYL